MKNADLQRIHKGIITIAQRDCDPEFAVGVARVSRELTTALQDVAEGVKKGIIQL